MITDNILDRQEAAKVLKVSVSTITRMVNRGELAGTYSYLGKFIRFNRAKLENSIGSDNFGATEIYQTTSAGTETQEAGA